QRDRGAVRAAHRAMGRDPAHDHLGVESLPETSKEDLMNPAYRYDTVGQFVGQELGVSDWITVDQARIDTFAACTGDRQWIHVDVDRAKRESPFGTTIAHGFLPLSLLGGVMIDLGLVPEDASRVVNAGLNSVRFKAPVRSGSR